MNELLMAPVIGQQVPESHINVQMKIELLRDSGVDFRRL